MKSALALLGMAAVFMPATAIPQSGAVTTAVAPKASAPAGCSPSASGSFQITVVNATSSKKRDIEERQASGLLTLTLAGGKLTDAAGRTGYIASNYQFQFDAPPQAGAIYTAGFSLCGNNSLALGGSTIFYQCYSGGFFNLYDRSWAAQCSPIYLVSLGSSSGQVSQTSDGQPRASTAVPAVSVKTDGQPQASTALSAAPKVSQLSDGQPRASSAIAVSQISDGQIQGHSALPQPVSQISDGQIQFSTPAKATSTAAAVSQRPDGQPIATSAAVKVSSSAAAAVSQRPDGQPIASSAAKVSSSAAAAVSQRPDGQPIASSAAKASSITSIPAAPVASGNVSTNGTRTSSALPVFTGAAATPAYGVGAAAAAGLMGLFAML